MATCMGPAVITTEMAGQEPRGYARGASGLRPWDAGAPFPVAA